MKKPLAWSRVGLAALATALGAAAAYFGQPLIHDNDQAIDVIVTVFSVLAGFLVAIIAIVGDPVLLPPGTWRTAEVERAKLRQRLIRHKWLFMLYLVTLALVFLALLLRKQFPEFAVWFEWAFLFSGVFAFAMSLGLPSALMRVQQERIDAVIEDRRSANGIRPPGSS